MGRLLLLQFATGQWSSRYEIWPIADRISDSVVCNAESNANRLNGQKGLAKRKVFPGNPLKDRGRRPPGRGRLAERDGGCRITRRRTAP